MIDSSSNQKHISDIIVRNMEINDLQFVVEVHKKAFPDFFMTEMGDNFLKSYYQTVINYGGCIAIVSIGYKNYINGFAAGFIDQKSFYKLYKKNWYKFLLPIFIGLLRRPFLIKDVFHNFLRINKMSFRDRSEESCELSSIGVYSQKKGVGSILLNAFIDKAINKKAKEIYLDTDLENNEDVIKFYKKHKFIESETVIRDNRKMLRMSLELNKF